MPKGPENRFIERVHRRLPPPPKPGRMADVPQVIETGERTLFRCKQHDMYHRGCADVWYSGPRDIWVEYKWVAKLPKKLIVPDLSSHQRIWLNGRFLEGRAVFVVVGSPDGCVIFVNPVEWVSGLLRDEALVQSETDVATWIQIECGLDTSREQQSESGTSTQSRSTAR